MLLSGVLLLNFPLSHDCMHRIIPRNLPREFHIWKRRITISMDSSKAPAIKAANLDVTMVGGASFTEGEFTLSAVDGILRFLAALFYI